MPKSISIMGLLDLTRTTHELVRRLISVFVEDLSRYSADHLASLNASHPDDIRNHDAAVIAFSPSMAADLEILRDFLFQNMWRHYKVNRMTSKAKRVVTELFDPFMAEPNTPPVDWQVYDAKPLGELSDESRARVIADYIASMTDRYAIIEYERLFDLALFYVNPFVGRMIVDDRFCCF